MKNMINKVIFVAKDNKGALNILGVCFLGIILCSMLLVHEVMRVHDLKEHLDDEIYRATNLAIKTAMYDSYRIDSTSRFDEAVAVNAFYDYLQEDLGLNSNYIKYDSQGNEAYRLVIEKVKVDGTNVRMNVKATAYADLAWKLWDGQWEIPIDIISRNMRTDI